MPNWLLLQNDEKSKYGPHYGPTANDKDGALVTGSAPIRFFVKKGMAMAVKIAVRTDYQQGVSPSFTIHSGDDNIRVGFIDDKNYADEKIALVEGRITPDVFYPDLTHTFNPDTNLIFWLVCSNTSTYVKRQLNLSVTINGKINGTDAINTFPVIITVFDPVELAKSTIAEVIAQPEIDRLTEHYRINAARNILSEQMGFLPRWIPIGWKKETTYFKDGNCATLHDYFKLGLQISEIPNNTLFSKDEPYLDIVMDDDNLQDHIRPFILWIDHRMIAWSRIHITKSDTFVFFTIDGLDYDYNPTDVRILLLPDNMVYTENKDELGDYNPILYFSKDGLFGGLDIFVYSKDNTLVPYIMEQTVYDRVELDIPFDQKLGPENFIIFGGDGTLYNDNSIAIQNSNIFTLDYGGITNKKVVVLYSTLSERNKSLILNALNEPFARDLISGREGWDKYDAVHAELEADFDFEHDKSLPYPTNLSNSQDYVWKNNVKHYDDVFYKHRLVDIMQVDETGLRTRYHQNNTITMSRWSPNQKGQTFPMVFQGGLLPSWYDGIKYTASSFSFVPHSDLSNQDGIVAGEDFEVCYFKEVQNDLLNIDKAAALQPDGSVYLHVTHNTFPAGKEVIYADIGLPDMLYPLPFTRSYVNDDEDILACKSVMISQATLYLGCENQFLYKKFMIGNDNPGMIELGPTFKTGFDPEKYMVFYNGRYLNRIYWRLLRRDLDKPQIEKCAIYTLKALNPGDRVEVFYCGGPRLNRISFNGDLMIKCIKTKAYTDGQLRFKVPYPFKSYPRIYDSFFCIKHSGYVDKSRYKIDGDYIEFYRPTDGLPFGRDLIFVFPYYRPDWDHDGDVNDSDTEQFLTLYKRTGEIFYDNHLTDTEVIDYTTVITSRMFHSKVRVNRTGPLNELNDWELNYNWDTIKHLSAFSSNAVEYKDYYSFQKAVAANTGATKNAISFARSEIDKLAYGANVSFAKDKMMVFFDTTFIHPDRYDADVTGGDLTITMKDEAFNNNTMVSVVLQTDANYSNDNILIKTVDIVATEDQQYLFDIPEDEEYNDAFFVINGTLLFTPDRYFVTADNKFFIVTEGDFIPKGEKITFVFVKDKNEITDPNYKNHYAIESIMYRCQERMDSMHIPVEYYHNFQFTDQNMLLFQDNSFITNDRYQVNGNFVVREDDADILMSKGSKMCILYVYRTLNTKREDEVLDAKDIIYFTDKDAERVSYDGQDRVKIPWIMQGITDTAYLVSKGNSIISPQFYHESDDHQWLIFDQPNYLVRDDKVRFTFVHNWGYTDIRRYSVTIPLKAGIDEYDIPSPFYKKVNLNNRMIVTYGNLYLDKERYMVDNKNCKIWLTDDKMTSSYSFNGRSLTFYFFYTGNEYNGSAAWLPQSGYVSFQHKKIENNFNKELYMMFVNGRKVSKSEILDITNSLFKVKTDIQRRFDLVILNTAPIVKEFKDKYMPIDDWSRLTQDFNI